MVFVGKGAQSIVLRGEIMAFVIITLLATVRYYQPFPMDDGAFFLRYADHIVSGYGYRWNIGESGPIGASAPLWPLLVAATALLGLPLYIAAITLSLALLTACYYLVVSWCWKLWGFTGGVILILSLAGSDGVLGPSMGGLETPLTVLLLSAAVYVIANRPFDKTSVAILGALLVIHKIDLAPWAIGLFGATKFNPFHRENWKPLAWALGLTAVYLILMWVNTGYIVPLSFMKKFGDSAGINLHNVSTVPRTWFLECTFAKADRWPVSILAALSLPVIARYHPAYFIFFVVGLGGQAAAYTIFPPTEGFIWYTAPATFGTCLMAPGFLTGLRNGGWRHAGASLAFVLGGIALINAEHYRLWLIAQSEYTEADRSRAGMWVASHTPPNFRVGTWFGNPAFFSKRYVYDFSGLNTALTADAGGIFAKYRPEIIILCPWKENIPPKDKPPIWGYKVVKGFASTLENNKDDFYTLVLVRSDVVSEVGSKAFEDSH